MHSVQRKLVLMAILVATVVFSLPKFALAQVNNTQADAEIDADSEAEELDPTDIVFNGTEVSPKEAIGLVTVLLEGNVKVGNSPGLTLVSCSGTLVAADVVLTAAHCLKAFLKKTDGLEMVVRYHGLDGRLKSAAAKDFAVNPRYPGNVSPFDVGLIHLAQPIKDRRPVQLATSREFINEDRLTVAGYGKSDRHQLTSEEMSHDPEFSRLMKAIKSLPDTNSGKLRKKELATRLLRRIGELEDAQVLLLRASMTGTVLETGDKKSMLKITDADTAVCEGDSGGPSFAIVNGRLKVVGVHSGGRIGNCDKKVDTGFFGGLFDETPETYGLDVFVPATPWISSQMKQWRRQVDI